MSSTGLVYCIDRPPHGLLSAQAGRPSRELARCANDPLPDGGGTGIRPARRRGANSTIDDLDRTWDEFHVRNPRRGVDHAQSRPSPDRTMALALLGALALPGGL